MRPLPVRTQAPNYLYIGCVDSRAPPENLLGLDIGDVLVQRNVANQVRTDAHPRAHARCHPLSTLLRAARPRSPPDLVCPSRLRRLSGTT